MHGPCAADVILQNTCKFEPVKDGLDIAGMLTRRPILWYSMAVPESTFYAWNGWRAQMFFIMVWSMRERISGGF